MTAEGWGGGEIAPGVTCILAPNPSAMTLDGTNTYLVDVPGGVVVVDPGPEDATHVDAIVRGLGERPCIGILLTHAHADHTGAVTALSDATGAPVLTPDAAPGGIETHATPGHTSDSVTYLVPKAGVALTGDHVLGRGTTVVAWPDGRLADYLKSLGLLRQLAETGAFALIGPGHGPAVPAVETLDAYLAHREQRLERVRQVADRLVHTEVGLQEALPARPAHVGPLRDESEVLPESAGRARDLADAIVAEVYTDVPTHLHPAARVSVLAQLEYLGLLPG